MKKTAILASIALLIIAAGIWFLRPATPASPPLAEFTGTYIMQDIRQIGWITVRVDKDGSARCVWNKVLALPEGKFKEQSMTFTGKAAGNRMELSAFISHPVNATVLSAAEKRGKNISLSIMLEKKEFFSGEYEPIGALGALAKVASFKENFIKKLDESKKAARNPVLEKAQEEESKRRAIMQKSNELIGYINDFLRGHKAAIASYETNTKSLNRYVANLKRTPGEKYAATRKQHIQTMHDTANLTAGMYLNQSEFIKSYNNETVPFIAELAQMAKECPANLETPKDDKEKLCLLAKQAHESLITYTEPLKKAISLVNASYKTQYQLQIDAINAAEKVQ